MTLPRQLYTSLLWEGRHMKGYPGLARNATILPCTAKIEKIRCKFIGDFKSAGAALTQGRRLLAMSRLRFALSGRAHLFRGDRVACSAMPTQCHDLVVIIVHSRSRARR